MATLSPTVSLADQVTAQFRRRKLIAFAVPLLILCYLLYTAVAFDLAGLAGRARMDNARILMADFYSHKTHVTRDNRSGRLSVAIEGEGKGTFPAGMLPDWVTVAGDTTTIDLRDGHTVTYDADGARYDLPGYGVIDIRPVDNNLVLTTPDGVVPDWINASDSRVAVTTENGRFNYTRSKVETFRYAMGWPAFFFTPESPYFGRGFGEILFGDRIDPARSNLGGAWADFLNNQMWRHGDVFWAMFETLLMAFVGTFLGAMVALPLSFMAARNTMPLGGVRFALRRLFDFIRGVDGLIWTIVLARAFGPGPMTGALAMALTDTGSFGKMYSEAIENIDEKQVEGIRSTGANAVQRARFGVLPQVLPVMLSQVLYFLESNTRSATVIGAIVGGGIGLMLTQAIQTQKDWEDVAWYIVLIVLMVMAMDSLSGWLRRKLIKGA